MLKADFHMHTQEDPIHRELIKHTAKDLIDHGARLGFEVLAITNHMSVYCPRSLQSYAKKKGILLIPGAEIRIANKDVLVYGVDNVQVKGIKTFKDLRKVPLAIAPHPYHILGSCLGRLLEENLEYFDAIEYSSFYTWWFNPNNKSERLSKASGVPMVGTSDTHIISQFGRTYSLLDCKKTQASVFAAIKKGLVEVKTAPFSSIECATLFLKTHGDGYRYTLKRKLGLLPAHRQGDALAGKV